MRTSTLNTILVFEGTSHVVMRTIVPEMSPTQALGTAIILGHKVNSIINSKSSKLLAVIEPVRGSNLLSLSVPDMVPVAALALAKFQLLGLDG